MLILLCMNNNVLEQIKNVFICEWLLLFMAFGLLIFRKQCFEVFEGFFHLIKYLLISLTAVLGFVTEALFILVGQMGMQGGFYLSDFYTNHLLPWFFFILLVDIVFYLLERIIYILKSDYVFGRKFLSGARIAMHPHETINFVLPRQRIVLLQ